MIWLISKGVTQKCNSSENLQRSIVALSEQKHTHFNNYFEKISPLNFSYNLDDLHNLDKFSFTFRSRLSQIIFKICALKISQYSQENTCVTPSLWTITILNFNDALEMDDFNFTNVLSYRVMGCSTRVYGRPHSFIAAPATRF